MISKQKFAITHTFEIKEDMHMLNTTKKTVLVLTLALSPMTALAQTTDTTTTPATTGTADTTGTTNSNTNQDNNRGFDYGWLGLLGLAGLAGLRRHTPVVLADRTTNRT